MTVTFDLVRQAKAGEREALDRLCARYYERVGKVVRLRLGERLRALLDVEDILQETFVQAVQAFDRFEVRDEASVINWLAKIAERRIAGAAERFAARKRSVRPRSLEGSRSSAPAAHEADGRPGPGTQAAAREQAAMVEECIRALPGPYAEIIVLRDYVGLAWEDVAREHGRPSVDAARMMHAKAMLELDRLIRARTPRPNG